MLPSTEASKPQPPDFVSILGACLGVGTPLYTASSTTGYTNCANICRNDVQCYYFTYKFKYSGSTIIYFLSFISTIFKYDRSQCHFKFKTLDRANISPVTGVYIFSLSSKYCVISRIQPRLWIANA